jgi:hypothetical protein
MFQALSVQLMIISMQQFRVRFGIQQKVITIIVLPKRYDLELQFMVHTVISNDIITLSSPEMDVASYFPSILNMHVLRPVIPVVIFANYAEFFMHVCKCKSHPICEQTCRFLRVL